MHQMERVVQNYVMIRFPVSVNDRSFMCLSPISSLQLCTHLVTNYSTERRPSIFFFCLSLNKYLLHVWNPKVRCHVYKSAPLSPVLNLHPPLHLLNQHILWPKNYHTLISYLFYLQPVAYFFFFFFCWNYRTKEHTNAIVQELWILLYF